MIYFRHSLQTNPSPETRPMTSSLIDTDMTVPVLLSEGDRSRAKMFAGQQPTPDKANQVYYNTLSICAVDRYLRILGFRPDLSDCDSGNPLMRMTMNVADLRLPGYGRLECRVVTSDDLQSDAPTCYVPTEVQDDRIGFLVVHVNEDEGEAYLLGFVDQVTEELLLLSKLRSLSELPDYLEQVHQPESLQESLVEAVGDRLACISQWFHDQVNEGWQQLDELLSSPQLAYQWRTPNILATEQLDTPRSRLTRAKVVTLNSPDQQERVVLIVEVSVDERQEFHLELHICPLGDQEYLPPGLDMKILDELGDCVMQAQTRAQNRSVELSFSAEPGDRFSLQLVWNHTTVTEFFLV